MARYTGPKTKISRRFGEPIFGPNRSFEKRNYSPGQHGFAHKKGKKSQYAIQLAEKQKAKYTYGILERQFANLFHKSSRTKGISGEVLLQLCEARLDNLVYRLGIAPSRRGARQLISHRHIIVNGKVVNIPSFTAKEGDIVGIREKSKSLEVITNSLASRKGKYEWLEWNNSSTEGKFLNMPQRAQIPENIKEKLIVELYSK